MPMVACPSCRRESLFAPTNPWRPFCSERCRQVDLGAWASEQFRVTAQPQDGEPADDASVQPQPQARH